MASCDAPLAPTLCIALSSPFDVGPREPLGGQLREVLLEVDRGGGRPGTARRPEREPSGNSLESALGPPVSISIGVTEISELTSSWKVTLRLQTPVQRSYIAPCRLHRNSLDSVTRLSLLRRKAALGAASDHALCHLPSAARRSRLRGSAASLRVRCVAGARRQDVGASKAARSLVDALPLATRVRCSRLPS